MPYRDPVLLRAIVRAVMTELLLGLDALEGGANAAVLRAIQNIQAVQENSGESEKRGRGQLRTIERAILSVVTGEPLTSKALARRAGYKCNSYFRGALADLLRAGLIRRGAGGYLSCQS